jgi:hypothetical protein
MLDFGSQIAESHEQSSGLQKSLIFVRTVVEEKPTSAAASKVQTKTPAK